MITIIGAGWYGCYIAMRLMEANIPYVVLEREDTIFSGSSSMNQNRLHQGYHYPRDYTTRISSLTGFEKFMNIFPDLSSELQRNIYAIHKNSLMDFDTYDHIFEHEGYDFETLDLKCFQEFRNYTGMIAVKERLIDFAEARRYFNSLNLNINFNCECHFKDGDYYLNNSVIKSELIIDCTYGQLRHPKDFYSERFVSFIYRKKVNTTFSALTIMDGPFYSIYPFYDDLYTVTGVVEGIVDEELFSDIGEKSYIEKRRQSLEKKISEDYVAFKDVFEFSDYFISTKTKPNLNSDNRSTSYEKEGNKVIVNSGKIDTVFECDSLIKDIIKVQSISQEISLTKD